MPIIDGETIQYDPLRSMECRAIQAPDNLTPFDFLEYFDEAKARELSHGCSKFVTETVLGYRTAAIEDALPLPATPNIFTFMNKQLGMEPYGKLILVEKAKESDPETSGFTAYGNLRATVVKNRIMQDSEDPIVHEVGNALRIENVAAHEVAHLAGNQDKIYFSINKEKPTQITHIVSASSKLQEHLPSVNGSYFEEGLATLAASMYLTSRSEKVQAMTATRPYRSPNGTLIHLPYRLNITGHHEYAFCAWGIERLIDLAPEAWDILLDSRQYHTKSEDIRDELRRCIEHYSYPGLFEAIDTTDIKSLDAIMETTARIEHEVSRYA